MKYTTKLFHDPIIVTMQYAYVTMSAYVYSTMYMYKLKLNVAEKKYQPDVRLRYSCFEDVYKFGELLRLIELFNILQLDST